MCVIEYLFLSFVFCCLYILITLSFGVIVMKFKPYETIEEWLTKAWIVGAIFYGCCMSTLIELFKYGMYKP